MQGSLDVQPHGSRARKNRLRTIAGVSGGLLIALFCALFFLLNETEPPFATDPELVRTTLPTLGTPPNAGIGTKILNGWFEYQRRKRPNPLNWSFPIANTNRCSVHGLLNQCMEVTGTQYFIEKKVAAGSVFFGSTNVQNGAQWVRSFETTLRASNVEWWDSTGAKSTPLVFLVYKERIKIVLTEPTAAQYQQRYPDLKRR